MIKIFIGTSANNDDTPAEQVLEATIRRYASEPVEIIWMRQSDDITSIYHGWNTLTWGTQFSGFRWVIPHACNFKGRAIYLDVDMLNFRDIAELFNTDMNGNALLIKRNENGNGWLSSVMLIDCEKIKPLMPSLDVIKQWNNINKPDGIIKAFEGAIGELDARWNMRDNHPLDIDDTWILHYTTIPTQPWKPKRAHTRKDLYDLWHKEYDKIMNKYLIRFNKTRGQTGRGSVDHVWRVFENGNEFLCKHIQINVPVNDERTGDDWNIACSGTMSIDKETSTIVIL